MSNSRWNASFKILVLSLFVSSLVLVLHQLVIGPELPDRGEYFFTELLRANLSWYSMPLLAVAAGMIRWRTGGSPIAIGVGMVALFPIALVYEGTVYRGSHNLLPFEMIYWALYSIPGFLGVFVSIGAKKLLDQRNS